MKKPTLTNVSTTTGFCLMVLLLAPGAKAQTSPVFDYTFPASWGGTGTTVTDQSSAGNNGFINGTMSLDAAPSGSAGQSVNTSAGGILTTGTASLNNPTIAAAGGFMYNVAFNWNGGTTRFSTQKIIDYAGTESLQLNSITGGTSASLQMTFANDSGAESTPVSTTILPGTWYNIELKFDTTGNSLDANGDISGTASLYVNGVLVSSGAATKGTYGDNLHSPSGRPIGVGQLGADYGYLVGFNGDIYDPSVTLGSVPEPSTLALTVLGGIGVAGAMMKRRRKA